LGASAELTSARLARVPSVTIIRHVRAVVIVLVIVLIVRTALLDSMIVHYGSMQPTLEPGDWILVQRLHPSAALPFVSQLGGPRWSRLKYGDIVIFESSQVASPTSDLGTKLIKRIVGLSGDTLWMRNGALLRNGHLIRSFDATLAPAPVVRGANLWWLRASTVRDIDMAPPQAQTSLITWGPIVVPVDSVFVLGDNLDESVDSRHFGPVPIAAVSGRARAIYLSTRRDSAGGLSVGVARAAFLLR